MIPHLYMLEQLVLERVRERQREARQSLSKGRGLSSLALTLRKSLPCSGSDNGTTWGQRSL